VRMASSNAVTPRMANGRLAVRIATLLPTTVIGKLRGRLFTGIDVRENENTCECR
jgi:hypothetical protein